MNRPSTLTAAFVKSVSEPGRYGDGRGGHGLSLLVKQTRNGRWSKSWSQRVRTLDGQLTNYGLGSYPVVTLARAREKALENRRKIDAGIDPKAGDAPTFREATDQVIELHRATWRDAGKSEKQWRASLEAYAFPRLGSKPVSVITSGDVLKVLTPIWGTKPETARRVRGRISTIMKWAVAEGHRDDNPAGDAIRAALPKHNTRKKHQPAIPHREVYAAIDAVFNSGAHRVTKYAFELLVLTACRSGEVRGARWGEIDAKEGAWTIPGTRTKTGRPHRVPLTQRILERLVIVYNLTGGDHGPDDLVFPSPTGRQLSDSTLSKLMRELGLNGTPHGFRSSFRQWCAETGVSREVAEACLAHVVGGVEGAYQRSDLLDARKRVMHQWSEYIMKTREDSRHLR